MIQTSIPQLLFVTFWVSQCQSFSNNSKTNPFALEPITREEEQTIAATFDEIPKYIAVPSDLVVLRSVKDDFVEVRDGPGLIYNIHDQLLRQYTVVVELERYKQWTKILDMQQENTGWVHSSFLQPANATTGFVTLRSDFLPLKSAKKKITEIHAFPHNKALTANIEFGTTFIALKKVASMTLVWIPQINSVALISADLLL